MEAQTNTKPQNLRMKILSDGTTKISGKSVAVIRFLITEELYPSKHVLLPPVSKAICEVKMVCDLTRQDTIIKNLRRLKHLPDRAWRDPAAPKPYGPGKEDI